LSLAGDRDQTPHKIWLSFVRLGLDALQRRHAGARKIRKKMERLLMSLLLMDHVLKLPVRKSPAKFLLFCMANYADPNGRCCISQRQLSEDTAMDRKTVISALAELEKSGHIARRGKRLEQSRHLVVYEILGINSPVEANQ